MLEINLTLCIVVHLLFPPEHKPFACTQQQQQPLKTVRCSRGPVQYIVLYTDDCVDEIRVCDSGLISSYVFINICVETHI